MIQFTSPINHTKLRMAYNNDIIEFYSQTPNASYADITTSGLNIRLYPNPSGKFWVNLMPYIKGLINTRDFSDNVQTNIQSPIPESFVYTYSDGTDNGVYLGLRVKFAITFEDESTESTTYDLAWIAGVQQIGNNVSLSKYGVNVLSPFKEGSTNMHYIKYWQGYPFDISIYYDSLYLKLKNNTNMLWADFEVDIYINRFFFSDGRTDETIEDVLPMVDGFNEIRILREGEELENDKFLIVEKVPYQCGVYLKWFNAMGGYSYWLFENTYSIDRSTKHIGEIDRDYSNLEKARGRVISIGKESQDTVRVIAELLNDDERAVVEGILDSPKVYLFTGKPFSQNSYTNWTEVSLKTGSARLKNPRQPLTNFSFDLELPERYTQTL
ncbi:hypothetical protein E0W68_09560 [Flavobacterium salilacus subsp. salilacus]|uniref:hypothetical protein n=1 Tax=Flavobacterium TaxID=237 RepID=UPI001074D84F|nr:MULTISPECIES: hypothetical protein [Flavobacterium]KAF2518261.1 hypothetical protein E0W68_09560 [Flavobacterium salilacus subsp. salilacus]MBE1615329.1 hypothetical protein [Flavobacterium sp. SaA2.13]